MVKWTRMGAILLVALLLVGGCGPVSQPETPGGSTPGTSDEDAPTANISNPANAFDAALAYLSETYSAEAPPAGLSWAEENVTPEQRVGGTIYRYRADDWDATVSFPVVAPDATIYTVEIMGRQEAFYWQGQVDAQGNVSENRVNPAQEAGLADAVQLEILKFDLEGKAETADGYVLWLSIDEPELLNQIVDALDTELAVAPKLWCIPEYTLRFHLQGGSTQDFGYSCGGASFLRGDQTFWQGQDYAPPEALDALIGEQVAATMPAEINVAEQAGLVGTVEIVIMESFGSEASESPGVVEVTVGQRLSITDTDLIAQVVASLDQELALGPRARMPVPYVLQFHLASGGVSALGYLPGVDAPSILRGDDSAWSGLDARPPLEFEALLREVLASTPAEVPEQAGAARDAAVAHVQAQSGVQAPGTDVAWAGRRTTPDGLLGAESFEFTSGDWVATVSYPVVAPEHLVYDVTLDNTSTGFQWHGQVTPEGQVTKVEN